MKDLKGICSGTGKVISLDLLEELRKRKENLNIDGPMSEISYSHFTDIDVYKSRALMLRC